MDELDRLLEKAEKLKAQKEAEKKAKQKAIEEEYKKIFDGNELNEFCKNMKKICEILKALEEEQGSKFKMEISKRLGYIFAPDTETLECYDLLGDSKHLDLNTKTIIIEKNNGVTRNVSDVEEKTRLLKEFLADADKIEKDFTDYIRNILGEAQEDE